MSNPAFPSDLAGSLTGEPVPPTLADFRNGSLPDAVGSRLRIQAVLPDYILRDLVRLLPACWAVDVSAPYRDEPPVSGDLVVIDTSLIGCQVEYKTAVNLIGEKSVVLVAGLHVLPIENALSIIARFPRGKVILQTGGSLAPSICNALSGLLPECLTRRIVRSLMPNLSQLPVSVKRQLIIALEEPVTTTPSRLAADCDLSRRSLDRHLRRAGLHSLGALLRCPRVLRAYALIHGSRRPLSRVARQTGYRSTRSLNADCKVLLGVEAEELRTLVEAEMVAERISTQVKDEA